MNNREDSSLNSRSKNSEVRGSWTSKPSHGLKVKKKELTLRALKTNGFYGPLNRYQIGSWVYIIIDLVLFYTAIIPPLDKHIRVIYIFLLLFFAFLIFLLQIPVSLVFILLLFAVLFVCFKCTFINPTDPIVKLERQAFLKRF